MEGSYVEQRDDGLLYLSGTRIPLALIDRAFKAGTQPEVIRNNFPSLSLEQVYGAITFCLAEPTRVSAYLRRLKRAEAQEVPQAGPSRAELRRRIAQRRALASAAK